MTYAQAIGSFAADLSFEDIPPSVHLSAKHRVLDILGLCLVTSPMDFAEPALNVARSAGGTPESTVIGIGDKLPASSAALVNGTNAHGLDFDDTHMATGLHPSACIVPTALAMAERQGSSGRDVTTAAIIGWETLIRMDLVAPGGFNARGFRPTAILSAMAATLVAGKLLGLSGAEMASALGINGSFAAGLREFMNAGSWAEKRIQLGWAAQSGILAALFAKEGMTGPPTILEGQFGLYKSHLSGEDYDLDVLTEGLGEVWETANISFKPYPACHYNHAFIDCTQEIKRAHNLRPEDVDRVLCRVAAPVIPSVCEPWQEKLNPPSDYDAKFSLPFAIATTLLKDEVVVSSYTPETIVDQEILALAQKVQYEIDPEAPFPQAFPGWVEIYTRDGRKLEHKMDVNRGSPAFPMEDQEIKDKFRSNAGMVLQSSKVEEIIDNVDKLEGLNTISDLMALCSP